MSARAVIRAVPLWKHHTVWFGTWPQTPPGLCRGWGLSNGNTLHIHSLADVGVWADSPVLSRNSPPWARWCTCCHPQGSNKSPQRALGTSLQRSTEYFPGSMHSSAAPIIREGEGQTNKEGIRQLTSEVCASRRSCVLPSCQGSRRLGWRLELGSDHTSCK